MKLNLTPSKVDISVENITVNRDSFYNLCFITENDIAPRTIVVSSLKELLDNRYKREDLAYNFCVGVFAQQGMPLVYIRAKRSNETYQQAFLADDNSEYYYTVIQAKDDATITSFNEFLTTHDSYKLQFYSSNKEVVSNKKIVHYHQTIVPSEDRFNINQASTEYFYINGAYKLGLDARGLFRYADKTQFSNKNLKVFLGKKQWEISGYQTSRLAYPEAAWVAECGNHFPSKVQWLHKNLVKTDVMPIQALKDIPFDSTYTTTSSIVMKTKATVGSAKTSEGVPINEQISLDWVKWALSKKVWGLLYKKDKLNATDSGKELILNEVKYVLDLAVQEDIFTTYNTSNVVMDSSKQTISVKFTAETQNTILVVSVSGSLYQ